MRYLPNQIEAIRSGALMSKPCPELKIDPITYAMDLFFIDDWLRENFYPQTGLKPDEMHYRTRLDFCNVLLRAYYGSPWSLAEKPAAYHWTALTRFLCARMEADWDHPDSLLAILEGI